MRQKLETDTWVPKWNNEKRGNVWIPKSIESQRRQTSVGPWAATFSRGSIQEAAITLSSFPGTLSPLLLLSSPQTRLPSVAPGFALPSWRTHRPGSQLEQLRRLPSAALPPTFIVVISSDVPMPSHRGTQGVCLSPFQRTRLRRGESAKRGPQTSSAPSWLPPGLCAKRLRRRDVLRAHYATASSQGHSRPPDSACALGGRCKAPPTSELTDVDFNAGSSLSSFHAVAVRTTSRDLWPTPAFRIIF